MADITPSNSTTLYRLFDKKNELLYVGIAGNVGRRMESHAELQPWWLAVTHITVEHLPSRPKALLEEKRVIKSEHPRYNIIHDDPRRLNPGEISSRTVTSRQWDKFAYGAMSVEEIIKCFRRKGLKVVDTGPPAWFKTFVGRSPKCIHCNRPMLAGTQCEPCLERFRAKTDSHQGKRKTV